jgi:hypothetical protein
MTKVGPRFHFRAILFFLVTIRLDLPSGELYCLQLHKFIKLDEVSIWIAFGYILEEPVGPSLERVTILDTFRKNRSLHIQMLCSIRQWTSYLYSTHLMWGLTTLPGWHSIIQLPQLSHPPLKSHKHLLSSQPRICLQ